MKIDPKKLKRQHQGLYNWHKNNYIGTFEWATGTGKSYLAILGVQYLLKKLTNPSILIVVHTDYLRNQWNGHIQTHDIPNATVETVHTLVKSEHYYDIVVFDEIHAYTGGDVFSTLFECVKRKYTIGLTAKEREEPEEQALLEQQAPIVDKLPLSEALREGYVSPFTVYNLGLELPPHRRKQYDRMHDQFIKYFSTFDFDLTLMFNVISDDEVCKNYAETLGWEKDIVKIHAVQANRTMQRRKAFLYSADVLKEAALDIIEKFPDRKILTFNEVTEFVDDLNDALEEKGYRTGAYHSSLATVVRNKSGNTIAKAVKVNGKTRYKDKKGRVYKWNELKFAYRNHKLERFSKDRLKNETMSAFLNEELDVVNTARALNEGADMPNVDLSIICSFTSSVISSIQRTGRIIRKIEDKRAIEVNLYIKNTQSEVWLKKKQRDTPNVKWITSIDEIVE